MQPGLRVVVTVSSLWHLSWVAFLVVRFLGVELLLSLPSSHRLPVPPDGLWLRGGVVVWCRGDGGGLVPPVCPCSRLFFIPSLSCSLAGLVLRCLFVFVLLSLSPLLAYAHVSGGFVIGVGGYVCCVMLLLSCLIASSP